MALAEQIRELNEEIDRFQWRVGTLPADLVLLGLATDVIETAAAVQQVSQSRMPHKAYANGRLAFEGAQNLLVLATHENYAEAGTRAWVYFELKTASWRAEAARHRNVEGVDERQLLERRVAQMTEAWGALNDAAGLALQRALAHVWDHRRARPDNWLHENMSRRHHRAYVQFAAVTGGPVEDTVATNRAMYEVLCHETHAHPRLDQFEIRVADGRFSVVRKLRGEEAARKSITGATEMAVRESIAALRWQRTGAP